MLRIRNILPKITLETYVSFPTLQRIAIPFSINKNKEIVGLIKKVHDLDPHIAKSYIYVEPKIIEQSHIMKDNTGKITYLVDNKMKETLLEKFSSSNNFEEEFIPIINDENLKNNIDLSKISSFFSSSGSNNKIKKWQKILIQNNGWFVIPKIKYKKNNNIENYNDDYNEDDYNEDDDKKKRKKIQDTLRKLNPCKYDNDIKKPLNSLSFEEFVIKTKSFIDANSDVTKSNIGNINTNDLISDSYYSKLFSTLINENLKYDEIINLLSKDNDISNAEKKHNFFKYITAISSISNFKLYSTSELQKMKKTDIITIYNDIKNNLNKEYYKISRKNKKDACKIITILNDLQDRKGWHNRITPLSASSTSKKAHHILIGSKSNDAKLNEEIKKAEDNIKRTIQLLDICNNDPQLTFSCLSPYEHVGIYGRNKVPQKYTQNSSIESEFRVYALLDIPLTFIRKSPKIEDRVSLTKYLIKGIRDAGVNFADTTNNIIDFKSLMKLSNMLGLPLTDPNTNPISFSPFDSNDNIMQLSSNIKKKLESTNNIELIKEYNDFENLKKNLINEKNIDAIKNLVILPSMYFPHEEVSYQTKTTEHEGCENTTIKTDKSTIKISNSEKVLLDGLNRLIRWEDRWEEENKIKIQKKTINDVISEIYKDPNLNNEQKKIAANPFNWKWSCIKVNNDMNKIFSPLNSDHFKFHSIISRRVIDLYNRSEKEKGNENKLLQSIDTDSISNALKDVATSALNLLTLGAITQMDDYVKGSVVYELTNKTWDEIKKGNMNIIYDNIKNKMKDLQDQYYTTDSYSTLTSLIENRPNVTQNMNIEIYSPQIKMFYQRRKDISKKTTGISNKIYFNPFLSNIEDRKNIMKNAPVALATDLKYTFDYLDYTPKK